MKNIVKARKPFRFCTRLHLTELTGLRAANLKQLLRLVKEVPGSCIYHHTHRFLQQHQYLSPEPPNDFAYWVTRILGEQKLGERLASIDTIQYSTIRSLREKIVEIIEDHLTKNPVSQEKFANQGEDFYFLKSMSFVLPTHYVVKNLIEFAEALDKVTMDSIYFHVFEARLRLEKGRNDFSNWIEDSFGDKKLAAEISRLDPYTYSMEDLRKKIIKIIKEKAV